MENINQVTDDLDACIEALKKVRDLSEIMHASPMALARAYASDLDMILGPRLTLFCLRSNPLKSSND